LAASDLSQFELPKIFGVSGKRTIFEFSVVVAQPFPSTDAIKVLAGFKVKLSLMVAKKLVCTGTRIVVYRYHAVFDFKIEVKSS
jgi:hypothetical protein